MAESVNKIVDKKIITIYIPKTCPGIHPEHELLPLMRMYGKYNDLNVKFVDDEGVIVGVKALHLNCTGKYVPTTKKSRTLKSCDACKDVHIKGVFQKRMRYMKKVQNVLDIMSLPRITDEQVVQLGKFSCDTSSKNPNKTQLIQQTINYCKYAKWFKANKENLVVLYPKGASSVNQTTPSLVGIVGAESVLSNFVSAYKNIGAENQDTLLEGLLMSYTSKMEGRMNAQYSSTILDLAQVLRYKSKAAYAFLQSNMLLPSLRHLQRVEAKSYDPKENILDIDTDVIQRRLDNFSRITQAVIDSYYRSITTMATTTTMTGPSTTKLVVSMIFDATKVVQQLSICPRTKLGLGYVYPDQLQEFKGGHEMKKAIESSNLTALASEIKCIMITAQNIPSSQSPCKIMAARPQHTNEVCNEFTSDILSTLQNHDAYVVVNISSDGLSSEQRILKQQTLKYMHGHSSTVGVMDPNHWAKACRSQLILGAEIKFIGKTMIDCGLLLLCKNIPKEVIVVADYTSDTKVLRLASKTTIESLLILEEEREECVGALGLCLFFLRLFLNACNSDTLSKSERLYSMWIAFIWFTSIKGIHSTTLKNLANCIMGLIWIVLREDVRSIRLVTTESLEHYFGHLRTWNADFNTLEFTHFCKKLDRILEAIFRSNLNSARGHTKGYLSGFDGYRQSVLKMLAKRNATQQKTSKEMPTIDLNTVDIDYSIPAVYQLEKNVLAIINDATMDMKKIITNPAIHATGASPFFRHFATTKELINTYSSYTGMVDSVDSSCNSKETDDADEKQSVAAGGETLLMSTLQRAVDDAMGELDLEDEDSVNKLLQEVAEFNSQLDLTESEIVEEVNVKPICGILQTHGHESLKTILAKLKDCLDKEKGSGGSASYIGDAKKMKSSCSRWFGVHKGVVPCTSAAYIQRQSIVMVSGEYYVVICCFKKSYGKFRMIQTLDTGTKEGTIFARKLRFRSMNSMMEELDECVRFSLKSTEINLTDLSLVSSS